MKRERVLEIAKESLDGCPVKDMDDLDFQELAMQIEDDFPDAILPRDFDDLAPMPPYTTIDALVDALMAYECHSTDSLQEKT